MIEILHLCAGYREKQVLYDISARLERGHLVGILGPNGCGKSTLLKTVSHLHPSTSGEVRIDGIPASAMEPQTLARHMAYVSQGRRVPDMTVGELVLHGRYPHLHFPRRYSQKDRTIAASAMETLGIHALCDQPLSCLSGGMQQSVYLAMALAQETDFILLDEPTTYLDIANQISLMQLLRRLTMEKGLGIGAVMHDLPLALTYADEIWVMQNGEIVQSGTPKQICASGVLTDLFGVAVTYENGNYFYKLNV